MSSLASQLQRLSGAVKGSPSHGRVPSFLFSREDASRLSVQDVLEVGVSGLEELKRVDARFAPLERPLFSPQAARTDRLTLTAAVSSECGVTPVLVLSLMRCGWLCPPHLFEGLWGSDVGGEHRNCKSSTAT